MEASLIALAQQGDETAFAALFKQHRTKVYVRCLGMIGSFQGKSAFATWLYRIATNVVLDHLRSKNPDAASLDDMEREPADPCAQTDAVAVDEILKLLPVGQVRDAVRLRMVEGFSVRETAVRLGIGPTAVARRVCDARRLLRERLA